MLASLTITSPWHSTLCPRPISGYIIVDVPQLVTHDTSAHCHPKELIAGASTHRPIGSSTQTQTAKCVLNQQGSRCRAGHDFYQFCIGVHVLCMSSAPTFMQGQIRRQVPKDVFLNSQEEDLSTQDQYAFAHPAHNCACSQWGPAC